MFTTIYKLMIDMDALSEPEATKGTWEGVKLCYGDKMTILNEHPLLNSTLGDAYWKWVKVRKLKSPRLDNAT